MASNLTEDLVGVACADPLFGDPGSGDYGLTASSPAVDAGLDGATLGGAPCLDRAGRPRVLDGDGDGLPVADLGALEFERVTGAAAIVSVVFVDAITLDWSESFVSEYAVYRGELLTAASGADEACPGTTIVSTFGVGPEAPLPGEGFYYLVGAQVGTVEGTLGAATCAERPNVAPCP